MPVFLEMGLPGEHNRIKGSCKDFPHVDWFELSSMQWGLVKSRDPTEPSQVDTQEIKFTMAQDESTSLLLKACLEGDEFKTVVIDFAKEGANGMESYYAFTLKDVIVSQCTTSGADHPVVSREHGLGGILAKGRYTLPS